MSHDRNVLVLSAVRTAIGKYGGGPGHCRRLRTDVTAQRTFLPARTLA